jgi:hypothetical protein
VLFGDEYDQAPELIYANADLVLRNYVSRQYQHMPHVHSIPLGYKQGFWGDARHQSVLNLTSLESRPPRRPFLWNFVGNMLASQGRVGMLQAIHEDWGEFAKLGPALLNLTQMWNDDKNGMQVRQ